MKKFFLIAATVFFALGANAQANDNAAEITFESETIDYGTIEQGSNGEREFVFTNTGKEPLIISNCKGSCGCTVPNCPKQPIAPGEKGVIKVKYDTKRIGQFTKQVTVNSNAKTPTKRVTIRGVVKKKDNGGETVPMKKETGASAVKVR